MPRFIAVFARYPDHHHRAKVAPGFTPYAGTAVAVGSPQCDQVISQLSRLAKAAGCQVRIQHVRQADLDGLRIEGGDA